MSASRAASALLELDCGLAVAAAIVADCEDLLEKPGLAVACVRDFVMNTWTLTLAARSAGVTEAQVVTALLECEPLRVGSRSEARRLTAELFA